MTLTILDIIAIVLMVITGIPLFILVSKAKRNRRERKPNNVNLIMGLATFVMVLVIYLFTRFWKY
jgi:hypothetical protein